MTAKEKQDKRFSVFMDVMVVKIAIILLVLGVLFLIVEAFRTTVQEAKSKTGIFEAEVIEVGSTYARVLYFVENTPKEVVVKLEDEQLTEGDIVTINVERVDRVELCSE